MLKLKTIESTYDVCNQYDDIYIYMQYISTDSSCPGLTCFDHAQVDELWVNHTSTAAGAPTVVRNMHREMLLGRKRRRDQAAARKIMENHGDIWKLEQKGIGVLLMI